MGLSPAAPIGRVLRADVGVCVRVSGRRRDLAPARKEFGNLQTVHWKAFESLKPSEDRKGDGGGGVPRLCFHSSSSSQLGLRGD